MRLARVVGAGLSGLTAAWRLTEAGCNVEVIEAAQRPGGLIETTGTPHGRVEAGANAFVWSQSVASLFASLGLTPQFASALAGRRYIFRNGRPRRWPLNFHETVTMVLRGAGTTVTGRSVPVGRESVLEWGDRVWGAGATRWLISPALQGLYAASAEELAAGAIAGSRHPLAARRSRSRIAAPRGGMSELMNRLVDRLRHRGTTFTFGSRLESLDPSIPTIVATSARAAAPLVAPYAPRLGTTLHELPTATLALVTAFFPPHDADVHGFGVLFPRGCGVEALGVRFDSDVFPVDGTTNWRAETWIRRLDESMGHGYDSSELWRAAEADRHILTGRSDEPVNVVTTCRPGALPLYGAGVLEIQQHLGELPPWLALAGNYMGRLGASKLLDVAGDAAGRVARSARSAS